MLNVNVRTNRVLRKNYQSNVNTLIKTKNKLIHDTQCSKSKEHNIKWSHAHVPVIVTAMFKVILFALFFVEYFLS